MDARALINENMGWVKDLARSHLAETLHEHLGHESIPDNQRWDLDAEIAGEILGPLSELYLRSWTHQFVNFLTYVHKWDLYNEMHHREIRLPETTSQYTEGFSNEDFQEAKRDMPHDKIRFLFGKAFGGNIWRTYAFPIINRGSLRERGYYRRQSSAA